MNKSSHSLQSMYVVCAVMRIGFRNPLFNTPLMLLYLPVMNTQLPARRRELPKSLQRNTEERLTETKCKLCLSSSLYFCSGLLNFASIFSRSTLLIFFPRSLVLQKTFGQAYGQRAIGSMQANGSSSECQLDGHGQVRLQSQFPCCRARWLFTLDCYSFCPTF